MGSPTDTQKMDRKDDTDKYLHKLEKKICGKLKKSDKNQKSLKNLLECLRKERKKAAEELTGGNSKKEHNFNEDECKVIADAKVLADNQKKRDERIQRINDYIAKNKLLEKEKSSKAKKKFEDHKIRTKMGLANEAEIEILNLTNSGEKGATSRELEDQARMVDSLERRKKFEAFAREGKKPTTNIPEAATSTFDLNSNPSPGTSLGDGRFEEKQRNWSGHQEGGQNRSHTHNWTANRPERQNWSGNQSERQKWSGSRPERQNWSGASASGRNTSSYVDRDREELHRSPEEMRVNYQSEERFSHGAGERSHHHEGSERYDHSAGEKSKYGRSERSNYGRSERYNYGRSDGSNYGRNERYNHGGGERSDGGYQQRGDDGRCGWNWNNRYGDYYDNQGDYYEEVEDGELSEEEHDDDEEMSGCKKAWEV